MSLGLTVNLYAGEKKHGAEVIVKTLSGQMIIAELLAVKPSEIWILDTTNGSKVNIKVEELFIITIIKKNKTFLRIGEGFLLGAGSGALLGIIINNPSRGWCLIPTEYTAAGGLLGIMAGAILANELGKDEKINFMGRSPEEIELNLRKLKKKARFPGGLPPEYKMTAPAQLTEKNENGKGNPEIFRNRRKTQAGGMVL